MSAEVAYIALLLAVAWLVVRAYMFGHKHGVDEGRELERDEREDRALGIGAERDHDDEEITE